MSWLWEANKRERRCGGTGWGEGGGAFRTSGCTPIWETFLLTWSALFLLLSLKLKLKSVDYSKSLKIQNDTANVPSILKYVENTLVDKGKHLSKKFCQTKSITFLPTTSAPLIHLVHLVFYKVHITVLKKGS